MSQKPSLVAFVNELANDPTLEALFDLEPVAVMQSRGLSEEQQALVLGGTAGQIRDALNEELNDLNSSEAVAFVIKKAIHIKMSPAPGGG
jgi:hypothetical protein